MVTIISRTNERRERDEMRRAHAEAARAAAARDDAELGISPRKASDVPELIRAALEAFGKPLAAKLKRMEVTFADYLGRRFGELRHELRKELLADLGEHRATRDRSARKAAETIARSAVIELRNEMRGDIVRLTAELEAARREIETLKQERGLRIAR